MIGVGSSQESGTTLNPLSSKVRIKIIKAGLRGTRIGAARLKFLEIPDFDDNDTWFGYVIKKYPNVEVVFSRTSLVKKIFRLHNITVISPEWYQRRRLVATKIRNLITEGKEWRDRVPKGAVREIARYKRTIKLTNRGMIKKRRRLAD